MKRHTPQRKLIALSLDEACGPIWAADPVVVTETMNPCAIGEADLTWQILPALNSSYDTAAKCTPSGQDDEILINEGNHIPDLPTHSLKLGLGWRAANWLHLGGAVQAFSGQFVQGNGSFQSDSNNWHHEIFVGPGAPRAARVPLHYTFGGK